MVMKILVVEDDVPTLELMSEIMTSLGLEVHPMGDSEQAATLINKEKFDGIFLDLMMPKVDGYELARQVRRSSCNKRTPVVIITGEEGRETLGKAFAAGATFFLTKPVHRHKLIQLLNTTRGSILRECRRFKRVSLRTNVIWQTDQRKITGQSWNISESGIFFETDGSLELGNTGQLLFHLPLKRLTIQANGKVVRVNEQGRVSVSFTYISEKDRQHIQDFIANIEEEEAP